MMRPAILIAVFIIAADRTGDARSPKPGAATAHPPEDRSAAMKAPAVRISTIDGTVIDARLLAIQDDRIFFVDTAPETHRPTGGAEALGSGSGQGRGALALDDVSQVTVVPPAESPLKSPERRGRLLYLSDGGCLRVELAPSAGDAGNHVTVDAGLDRALDIPFSAMAAVHLAPFTDEAADDVFAARLKDRDPGRDLLIAVRDGKPVVVPGALERLGPEQFSFRVGGSVQTAPLDKAFAFVLAAPAATRSPLGTLLRLTDGGTIHGIIEEADERTLRIAAGELGTLDVRWPQVDSLELQSDRVVHLSDLEPSETDHHTLFGASWPPKKNRNVAGGPLVLGGRRFDKGLGVHAFTALSYALDGAYERFTATIGIDDGAAPHGSAVFRVRLDGQLRYESPLMRSGQTRDVSVDLRGAARLTLECDMGDELDLSDHGDWAAARLIRARADPLR